jgi:hypothetical protein
MTRSATRRGKSSAALTRWASAAWVTYSEPITLRATIRSQSWMELPTRAWKHHPRVVDQHVDPSELRDRPLDRTGRLMAIADVGLQHQRNPSPLRMLCPTASRRSFRRATSATRAPCWASATAVAAPIPLEAPVTSAAVPFKATADDEEGVFIPTLLLTMTSARYSIFSRRIAVRGPVASEARSHPPRGRLTPSQGSGDISLVRAPQPEPKHSRGSWTSIGSAWADRRSAHAGVSALVPATSETFRRTPQQGAALCCRPARPPAEPVGRRARSRVCVGNDRPIGRASEPLSASYRLAASMARSCLGQPGGSSMPASHRPCWPRFARRAPTPPGCAVNS